jgi:hypothetical protein
MIAAMLKQTPDHHDAELLGCPEGLPVYERIKARVAQLAAARG